MATSQNGWPVLDPISSKLHTWTIDGPSGETKIRMRNGSAGFLLAHLALWFDGKIEELDEPVLDEWGYAFRPVRGFSAWSNHASGTAIDLNATDHPLAAEDTFPPAERARIIRRVNDFYRSTVRWGGTYRGRRDEMHFEINAPLAACETRARDLLDSPRGERILAANPGQRAVILS